MNVSEHVLAIFASLGVFALTGCGIVTPKIQEAWDADKPAHVQPLTPTKVPAAAQIEWEIKKKIYCELKQAVQKVNALSNSKDPRQWYLPPDWSALVSISLQVEETSALSPGATVVTSPVFSPDFGGTLSSTATRVDKFDPYWSVSFLMIKDTPKSICMAGNDPLMDKGWTAARSSPLIIGGDLGIHDWLLGSVQVSDALASEGSPPEGGDGPGRDTISYQAKFIIVTSGNLTPMWTLVRFSGNVGSPLFSTGRTRTHDLIITIGPSTGAKGQQANTANLALQVGNAVANANRAVLRSQ